MRHAGAYILTAGAFFITYCPTSVHAQQAPTTSARQPASSGLSEIIVTANKREQSVQDVGIAVTALGEQQLTALGRQEISHLSQFVPGLQIVEQGTQSSIAFNIRGVAQNAYSANQEAPIAFYSDGVYIANRQMAGGSTFDLQRVEVLRGPQGTLFGRNATGGLVQVISAKPTADLEGFVTLSAESFGRFMTEGAVSGPLSSRVRARLAFMTDNGGAFLKNQNPLGRDLNGLNFRAVRAQIASDVGSSGLLLTKFEYMRNDNDTSNGLIAFQPASPNSEGQGVLIGPNENPFLTCPGCDRFGYRPPYGSPLKGFFQPFTNFNREIFSGTATYTQNFGDLQFTSVSDYRRMMKHGINEGPYYLASLEQKQLTQQASQELRLAQNAGNFRWTVGAYGLYIKYNSLQPDVYNAESIGFPEFRNSYRQHTVTVAGFAQAEYDISPQFTVIGGGRYSYDRIKFAYTHVEPGLTYEFNTNLNGDLARYSKGNWSGKIELDFKPSRDVLIYASVNRGTKAGGFNIPAFAPSFPQAFTYDEEILTSYEGGFKTAFLNRAAHFNVSAFHYNYAGYQSFQTTGINRMLVNQKAPVSGAEADFDIRPVDGLTLTAFAAYLHGRIKAVKIPETTIVRDTIMPNAPKWSFGGLVSYTTQLAGGDLTLSSNWKWNSSQYFTVFNEPVSREPAYAVGNVRISYKPADLPIEAAFYINNVTNKLYRTFSVDDSSFTGNVESFYGRPRAYGVSLTIRR